MIPYKYSSLDLIGLLFFVLAIVGLIYSIRERTVGHNDSEASAAILDGSAADNVAIEDQRRVRRGAPVMIAVFVLMLALMAAAPIATIVISNRAVSGAIARAHSGIDP